MDWRGAWRRVGCVIGVVALALTGSDVRAEDPPQGWTDKAELSFVQLGGNARSTTFGLKNELLHRAPRTQFAFRVSGVRAQATDLVRTAVLQPDGGVDVVEDRRRRLSAEAYAATVQYDRKITERLFWNAGLGWERNRFKGIESRWSALFGLGSVVVERERLRWRTEYGATLTRQQDITGAAETFGGFRLGSDLRATLSATTTFENLTSVDDTFEDLGDWRASMTNAVSVSISKRLALKAAVQLLYDARPSLESVPVSNPLPGGATSVTVPLKRLDSIVTTSLVVNF